MPPCLLKQQEPGEVPVVLTRLPDQGFEDLLPALPAGIYGQPVLGVLPVELQKLPSLGVPSPPSQVG